MNEMSDFQIKVIKEMKVVLQDGKSSAVFHAQVKINL